MQEMNVTVTLRLKLTRDEVIRILPEVRRFNEAAQWLSAIAFAEKFFSWLPLQRRAYRELRERFGLKAAQAVVCVRKVASAYSNPARRLKQARFRPLGSIPLYAHRYKRDGTLAFYGTRFPFLSQPDVALSSACEARLVWDGSKFLIHQALEVEVASPAQFAGPSDAVAAENIRRAAGSRPDAAA
jgi:hypothetical protein